MSIYTPVDDGDRPKTMFQAAGTQAAWVLVLVLAAGCSNGGGGASDARAPDVLSSTDAGGMGMHQVGQCNALAAPGTWEQITPPQVAQQLPPSGPGGPGSCTFGVGAFVLDPANSGTIYLGTCNMGIWKSTDCGASWLHVNTGTNGAALDNGRQWTFVVDPNNSQTLYANSGYNGYVNGATFDGNGVSGAFKSTNGGVDWQVMWPPSDPVLAAVVQYNFVGSISIDPTNSQHLLLAWHATCAAPYTSACIGESTNGGQSWRLINGEPGWVGGEGQALWFLGDSNTWMWASATNGMWRTTDGGASWTQLCTDCEAHGAGQMYRARNGAFYLGGADGVHWSPDGITWSLVPNSGTLVVGLVGDGTTMWSARGFPWNPPWPPAFEPFETSPESDGQHWSPLTSPMLLNGGALAYDPDHHVLYSSDEYAGFWRVVTQ